MANSSQYEIAINIAGKLEKSFMSAFKSAGSAVKGLTKTFAATGAVLTGLGGFAIKVGSEFEASMSQVAALSGATGDEFKALEDKAKEMGSSTQYSATECANALSYMALAGWNTQQSVDGLSGILNMAAASGMDLASASDAITDILSAFGMQASESGKLADEFALAQATANTSADQLSQAMKNCGVNAAGFGQDITQTNAVLMALSNEMLKGSEAGTSVSAMIRDMGAKMKDGAIKIGNTSVAVTDASGDFLDFVDIVKGVEKATDGMTESQRQTALSNVFTADSIKAMGILLNEGSEKIEGYANQLDNAGGSAEKMAKKMNDNLKGQLTTLQSAMEGLGIELYQSMDNPMKDVVKSANDMVTELTEAFLNGGFEGLVYCLGDVFSQIVQGVASFAPDLINASIIVIQAFVDGISDNINSISGSAGKIVEALAKGLVELMPSIAELGVKVIAGIGKGISEGLADAFPGLGAVFEPLKSAFQWVIDNSNEVILALVGIGTGLAVFEVGTMILGFVTAIQDGTLAVKAMAKAQGILNAVMAINPFVLIAAAIAGLVAGIIYLWNTNEGFRDAVIGIWQSVCDACNSIFGSVCSFFTETIPDAMNTLIDFVTNNWKSLLLFIVNPFAGAFDILYNHCDGFKSFIDNFIQSICLFFTVTIPDAFNNCCDAVSVFGDSVASFFTETIPNTIRNLGVWFSKLPSNIAYNLGVAVGAIANWIVECYTYLSSNIPIWIDSIGTWFANLPGAIWTWLSQTITNIGIWGANMLTSSITCVSNVITSIGTWFSNLPGIIGTWLSQTITNIGLWGTDMLNTATTFASSTITAVITWFSQLPSNIWNWLVQVVANISSWGLNMLSTATQSVSTVCDGIVDGFTNLPGKMVEIGTNIVNGIKNGIKNAWDNMTGWIGGLCENFVVGVKSEFDIHSPSRVMKNQVGKWIPLGISEGLKSTTGDLLNTATNMCSRLSDSIKINSTEVGVNWNAEGGIFDKPTIFGTNKGYQGVGEAGAEAILPLNLLWDKMKQIISDLMFDNSNRIDFDSLINKLDGNSKSHNTDNYEYEPTIQYSPVYKFYGAAPSKEDLMQASKMSQDEFSKMMKKYEKDNGRFKFA